ncbi:MAG: tetratricopeptide repeat protein [Spirochaetota bacterium]
MKNDIVPSGFILFLFIFANLFLPEYAVAIGISDGEISGEETVHPQTDGEIPYATAAGILSFADYLYLEKDYQRALGEYQRYLFLFPTGRLDTVYLKVGMSLERAGNYAEALDYFNTLSSGTTAFDIAHLAAYETALTYIRMGNYNEALKFLNSKSLPSYGEVYNAEIISSIGLLFLKEWKQAGLILENALVPPGVELGKIAEQARGLTVKSPFVAAFFSTFIPGLGKIYAGRWKDGLFSLVTVGLFAGLSAYNFYREGIYSVKGWIYGGLGAVFHIGNIYGSALAARQFNELQHDKIFSEVWNFVDKYY